MYNDPIRAQEDAPTAAKSGKKEAASKKATGLVANLACWVYCGIFW